MYGGANERQLMEISKCQLTVRLVGKDPGIQAGSLIFTIRLPEFATRSV